MAIVGLQISFLFLCENSGFNFFFKFPSNGQRNFWENFQKNCHNLRFFFEIVNIFGGFSYIFSFLLLKLSYSNRFY